MQLLPWIGLNMDVILWSPAFWVNDGWGCREKHADVLEWLCFLQSHADIFKRYMYGE